MRSDATINNAACLRKAVRFQDAGVVRDGQVNRPSCTIGGYIRGCVVGVAEGVGW